MTPVIVALFDDFGVATRVRTELVKDGFPTDRVELTSRAERGQADAEPGESYWQRVSNYFHAIFDQVDDGTAADDFAERVRHGGSVITVHPRSEDEINSARTILRRNGAMQVREH